MDISSNGLGSDGMRNRIICKRCRGIKHREDKEFCDSCRRKQKLAQDIKDYQAKVKFELSQIQVLITGLGYKSAIVSDGFSYKLEVYSERTFKDLND